MKSPDDEYSDGLEAELEAMRKENAALLVAIEAKDVALRELEEAARCVQAGEWDRNSIQPERMKAKEALDISPSTELLEARDRKRDAKLLRAAWNRESRDNEQLIELAAAMHGYKVKWKKI